MSQDIHPDRLEQYTHGLQNAGAAKAQLLCNPILAHEEPIFALVRWLHHVLRPVSMDPAFKAALRKQLVEAAARERAQRQWQQNSAPARSRLPWIASAAMLGATATLAGVYAVWRWGATREAA